MKILERLYHYRNSNRVAAYNLSGEQITYQELWRASDRLAAFLLSQRKVTTSAESDRTAPHPLPVVGHKDPLMLVCFLAAVKSGVAYCPIDTHTPASRIHTICNTLHPSMVINLSSHCLPYPELGRDQLIQIMNDSRYDGIDLTPHWVDGDQTFYTIFTSGSTGTPKGVQISAESLMNFLAWISTIEPYEILSRKRYLNQAPLSFDLSVMDVYLCLMHEGTLIMLDKNTQEDFEKLSTAIKTEQPQIWVSTPSFAELCLADGDFHEDAISSLKLMVFCGETLTHKTASRLRGRFSKTRIHNTYGPTESTVCVTDILITDEVLTTYNPLPVGRVRSGSSIKIITEENEEANDGQQGEIIIIGDTVSTGYYQDPERNFKSFFVDVHTKSRGYRTGDIGYILNDLLFYCRRKDSQIKYHGYRIELGDIEKNLLLHPDIAQACIVPRYTNEGKVRSLTACVVYTGDLDDPQPELIAHLEQLVPSYMVVRRFKLCDSLPLTLNGKVDRNMVSQLI